MYAEEARRTTALLMVKISGDMLIGGASGNLCERNNRAYHITGARNVRS